MNKLPDGWEIKKLKDILSNEKYSIKRGPFGSSLKKEFFIKEGVKVFEQYNPINNDPHWCRYRIDKKKYEELKAFSCRAGDFLISCSGTLGKILLLPDNVEEGIINQALLKIRLNNKLVDNYYFLNLFQYEDFQKRIYIDAVGSAIHNIASVNILKEMEVIIPPLDEQKRIASALSKIDAYLENTIKLIEEKERFKRGIAKKLLTCKEGENIPEARFRGFEGEWEIKTLSSISNIKKGEQKNKLDLIADGKYPVLNGGMNFSGYCNSYNREANTITISEGGNAGYVNFIKEKFWSSGHCYTLHDLKIDKYFLYQCLKNSEKRLMKLQLGTALKNIRQSEIVEFELNIPKSIKEQEKIGGYLSLLDAEIDNLKKQKELIKEMKRGAMQKLLSGEVRLVDNYD